MLPADAWPKSNTASFTKNWAKDLPDDSFLHDIVIRWRAQSHNPELLGFETSAAQQTAALAPAQPAAAQMAPQPQPMAQPSLRRQIPGAAPAAASAGAPAFGQHQQQVRQAPPPPPPPPAGAPAQQQSLANLIRQFRG
jgi:hypothetical protein